MALVKNIAGVELRLEFDGDRLCAVGLPKQVPADLDAAGLRKIVDELSNYELSFPNASSFTRAVWEKMRSIPAGRTSSYGDLAESLECAKGARAVGSAVGRNKLLIILPCHRVVAKNGLGGFREGLAWKRKLLELEAVAA